MSETTNLKLFKHNEPLETNENQFDVDLALNQNWDKIDDAYGNLNTDIENLQINDNKQDELISKLKSVALNAETEESKSLHVTDANKFGQLEVLGNQEQDGEPSPENEVPVICLGSNKNILDTSLIQETTKGGITSKINSDGSITFDGVCNTDNNVFDFFIENQTKFMFDAIKDQTTISAFYISGSIKDENNEGCMFRINNNSYSGNYIDLTKLSAEKIITRTYNSTSGSAFCDIRIDKNVVLDNFTIKLKAANTLEDALTYSPYGQGSTKISNTNENFLDLINAKTNEATYTFQNDVLTVKSSSPGGYNKIYIDLLELFKKNPGKTIIFQFEKLDISKYNSTSNGIVQIQYTKNNVSDYPVIVTKDGSRYEFNIPEDVTGITTAILNIFANNTNKYVESSISITKPMLLLRKLSENKIDYVEHQQTDYILNIQQEMLSGDYFIKEADGWKEVHGWNIYETSENDNWQMNTSGLYYLYNAITSSNINNIALSNYFKFNSRTNGMTALADGEFALQPQYENNPIYCKDNSATTLEDFKNSLATKIVKFYYKTETPTKLPCTEAQSAVLEELNNLDLFEGVNNIITAEDIALLKLKYALDVETYVDNKIEEKLANINQQILEIEGV